MRFDPHAIKVEGKRVTFPIEMTLPPVCMYTGVIGPIEYNKEAFEYLPGTEPGGAEPKRRKASIEIPKNATKSGKEKRLIHFLISVTTLGFLLQLNTLGAHRRGSNFAEGMRLLGMTLTLVYQCYWFWKMYWSTDRIECMKIEGEGNATRITLLLPGSAAKRLQKYIDECHAKESKTEHQAALVSKC